MYRNQNLLKAVRSLPCSNCGHHEPSEAAHQNEGKGMGLKQSDSHIMALCHDCHVSYDQGSDMDRAEKRAFAWQNMAKTYIALVESGMLRAV